jgi:anaerobic selenocysteine-containing dehydrogenase
VLGDVARIESAVIGEMEPGTDTALFSGLLVHLADHGALDPRYIAEHTAGFGTG